MLVLVISLSNLTADIIHIFSIKKKKKYYCGHVIYHVILLVIISNYIPLSLPIVLTYYFIPDGSLIQYTSPSSYYSFKFLLTNISFIET